MECSSYSPRISQYLQLFPLPLSCIYTDTLPPFIYNDTYTHFSHPIGNVAEPQPAGRDVPPAAGPHCLGETARSRSHFGHTQVDCFPFLVYEYIQSNNTQPSATKEILINLLNPRTSKDTTEDMDISVLGLLPLWTRIPRKAGSLYNDHRSIGQN